MHILFPLILNTNEKTFFGLFVCIQVFGEIENYCLENLTLRILISVISFLLFNYGEPYLHEAIVKFKSLFACTERYLSGREHRCAEY